MELKAARPVKIATKVDVSEKGEFLKTVRLNSKILFFVFFLIILCLPASQLLGDMDKATGSGIAHQTPQKRNYYIEISISQCKLTVFEKGDQNAMVPVKMYKVGTAVRGLEVFPVGKGKITRIDLNPYWYPTGYTREIYEQKGIELPMAVPPGHPLNYMGMFKIHLSHATSRGSIYRIHGNNNKNRIGKRVTGGCICMDNVEGVELAKMVSVGTEVNILL